MKTKHLTLLALLFLCSISINAQLPDGSIGADFTVTDINNNSHNLYDILDQGKSVILDLSATWCGPCLVEIPHLIALRSRISEEKLAMLAISFENENIVKKFVKRTKMNYTIAAVNPMSMPRPYNMIRGIPSSFFIDTEGKIKLIAEGAISTREIEAILKADQNQ